MAPPPFTGCIPDDRLYCPNCNMWVKEIEDGYVLIGASAFGLFLAGEVLAFTSKPRGAEIERGRGMGTIECRKTVMAVHAPLSFTLLEGNEEVETYPGRLNRDAYGAGWMARGKPTPQLWMAEKKLLVTAAAYRQHILSIEPGAQFADPA